MKALGCESQGCESWYSVASFSFADSVINIEEGKGDWGREMGRLRLADPVIVLFFFSRLFSIMMHLLQAQSRAVKVSFMNFAGNEIDPKEVHAFFKAQLDACKSKG